VSPGRPTGERVVTASGGFNPTWQRHVAAYALAADILPPGRVLDLGCGVGHSFELLAPRESVGVDIDAGCLRDQRRETRVADMRELPFPDRSFASVLSVQSIEHVPDPERAVAEAARVLEPGGVGVFVTPNRLTFGRPTEIIDPYHYLEFDPGELRRLLASSFQQVEIRGIFGSALYMKHYEAERRELDRLLARDPLRLRRMLSRRLRQRLYDWRLGRARGGKVEFAAISPADFRLAEEQIEQALDLVAIARGPST
jgi:SAM-dependent methyltransferase